MINLFIIIDAIRYIFIIYILITHNFGINPKNYKIYLIQITSVLFIIHTNKVNFKNGIQLIKEAPKESASIVYEV